MRVSAPSLHYSEGLSIRFTRASRSANRDGACAEAGISAIISNDERWNPRRMTTPIWARPWVWTWATCVKKSRYASFRRCGDGSLSRMRMGNSARHRVLRDSIARCRCLARPLPRRLLLERDRSRSAWLAGSHRSRRGRKTELYKKLPACSHGRASPIPRSLPMVQHAAVA